MSLLMMEGFDYYSDDQQEDLIGKFTTKGASTTAYNAVTGRDGIGQALRMNESSSVASLNYRWPSALQTVIVGFSFKYEVAITGLTPFLLFFSDQSPPSQMQFNLSPGGGFNIKRGAITALRASRRHLSQDTWYHFEVKYHVDDSVGTVEVRIDGGTDSDNWINFGPGDTNNLGPDEVTSVSLLSSTRGHQFDDFYCMDTTGSRLNDFIGDNFIEMLKPDGVGNDAAWTPLAGTNWEAVDETIPDRDSTAVDAVDDQIEDRHTHANFSATIPSFIHAVAVNLHAQKLVTGSRNVKALAFDGTTEGAGADKFPTVGTYTWHQHIFEDHPTGAAVWTGAEVNSGEFGYRLEA